MPNKKGSEELWSHKDLRRTESGMNPSRSDGGFLVIICPYLLSSFSSHGLFPGLQIKMLVIPRSSTSELSMHDSRKIDTVSAIWVYIVVWAEVGFGENSTSQGTTLTLPDFFCRKPVGWSLNVDLKVRFDKEKQEALQGSGHIATGGDWDVAKTRH